MPATRRSTGASRTILRTAAACICVAITHSCASPDRTSPDRESTDDTPIATALRPSNELTPGVIGDILRDDPRFARFASDPSPWRLQIIVSEVMPPDDAHASPWLRRYAYRADEEYFYPASTVKLLAAAAALEKLTDLETPTPEWHLTFDPAFEGERRETDDATNLAGGLITTEHEIRKLFLVSDNRAFNRLYDIVGHEELNERSWRAGLPSTRLTHRLSIARSAAQNMITRRVTLTDARDASNSITIPQRNSGLALSNEGVSGLVVGKAQIRGGKRIEDPKDFTRSNRVSLFDLHNTIISIVRPDLDVGIEGFLLTDDDRELLLAAMTPYPGDSANPAYDRSDYPDDWGKFMLSGIRRAMPDDAIRYANKIGLAYGFTTETAYVEDTRTGRAFFVTATIYTNANQTLNDNVYEYDAVAMPFWADLGEALARRLLLDQGSWSHERATTSTNSINITDATFTEAVMSFNAETSDGTGVEGQLRVRSDDREWSPWLTLAAWGQTPPPTIDTQSGTLRVDIDELRSDTPLTHAEARFVPHAHPGEATPDAHRLDLTLSRLDATLSVAPSAGPSIDSDVPFRTLGADPALASRLCSPTSLSMLLAHRGVTPKPDTVINAAHDPTHDLYGVWPTNIQAAFALGAPGYLARFSNWHEVRRHLDDTGPIAISITAEQDEVRNLGYTSGGHILVLAGLTSDGDAIVLDPAYSNPREARRVLPARDLARVWLQRKRGTAYVLLPTAQTNTANRR